MISKTTKKQYLSLILVLFFLFLAKENINFIKEEKITPDSISQKREILPEELFLESYKVIKNNYWDKNLCGNNLSKWKKRYENKIKDEDDAKVAINSILASLDDPYSKFLDKKEFIEQSTSIDSKIYGIGINIITEAGKIVIMNVIKGTPADYADLRAGDLILKVNGENAAGKSIFQIAAYIKNPEIETVNLEILRQGKKLTKQVKKAEIKIKTVKSEILDKQIGYIRISSFISANTPIAVSKCAFCCRYIFG